MAENLTLFSSPEIPSSNQQAAVRYQPLAEKLRPTAWEDFQGLDALNRETVSLLRAGKGMPPSLVFWGPPGSGKTTLAKLIGSTYQLPFVAFSAVLGGVKEVREIVSIAKRSRQATLLFVDEIHRFNRGQQDAFLPHVEDGTIILLGATTENPSFYLTGALLSRCRVVVLPALGHSSLERIIQRAGKQLGCTFENEACTLLVKASAGDARRLLNLLEALSRSDIFPTGTQLSISAKVLTDFLGKDKILLYDRSGEEHYNLASAFIKSMRGSDPDAALYWGFRMLEGGEDPFFLLRRMMIFASEDIGNADPHALPLAVATVQAYERIGFPEAKIPIAHCITYLASAQKSNSSYVAMKSVLQAIEAQPNAPVPLHLRNAPTKLMQDLRYGEGYEYSHDFAEGESKQQYLPESLKGQRFYQAPKSRA